MLNNLGRSLFLQAKRTLLQMESQNEENDYMKWNSDRNTVIRCLFIFFVFNNE